MVKLTKSMPIVKERTCTASMVLDTRTNRKNVSEFPLAVRFTIDRKLFYYQVGSSYTEKKFFRYLQCFKECIRQLSHTKRMERYIRNKVQGFVGKP